MLKIELVEKFTFVSSGVVELLVDFGGEGGDEGLEEGGDEDEGLDGGVGDLGAAEAVGVFELVGLLRLEVAVAKAGGGHGGAEAVLDAGFFEEVAELDEFLVQSVQKGVIIPVSLAFIGGDLAFKNGKNELETAVGEVTEVGQELAVVLVAEVAPGEGGVLALGPVGE